MRCGTNRLCHILCYYPSIFLDGLGKPLTFMWTFHHLVGTAHIEANITVTTQVSLLGNDCLLAVDVGTAHNLFMAF
jgi:hypothetical protein